MENLPLSSNEFIQEANLWSQSQSEETFMMTLRNIRNNLPYLFGYLVVTAWTLIEALIENGIDDFQAKSLYISRAVRYFRAVLQYETAKNGLQPRHWFRE